MPYKHYIWCFNIVLWELQSKREWIFLLEYICLTITIMPSISALYYKYYNLDDNAFLTHIPIIMILNVLLFLHFKRCEGWLILIWFLLKACQFHPPLKIKGFFKVLSKSTSLFPLGIPDTHDLKIFQQTTASEEIEYKSDYWTV